MKSTGHFFTGRRQRGSFHLAADFVDIQW